MSDLQGLIRIDHESVKELADEIGKSNVVYNKWQALLNTCAKFEEHGLQPQIVYYTDFDVYFVTTEYMLEGKLN